MVEIRKGSKTLTVPAGAVRKYTSAGWKLTGSSKSEDKVENREKVPSNNKEDENEDSGEAGEDLLESEYEEIEVDPEELAQRPLNTLDREELTILAEFKGIDTSEITSAKQLRAALRALE